MSIFRVYSHSVPVSGPDYKGKTPRTKPYSYPIIREEKDGSSANPHKDETLLFEGNSTGAFAASIEFGKKVLSEAGKNDLLDCYDPEYVTLRGLNDIAGLELDPQRWSEGGGTRDGSGLKVSRLVDTLWANSARGAAKFSETAKSIPSELYDRVIAKLQAEGEGGQKLVRAIEKVRQG